MLKKIGIWAGIVVGGFILMLVGAYFLYPYIHPQAVKKLEQKKPAFGETNDFSGFDADSLKKINQQVMILQDQLDSLKTRESQQMTIIDSLNNVIQQKKHETVNKVSQPVSEKEDFSEITKSLLNLEPETLSPIVNKLTTSQLIRIYRNASTMQRQKLLSSLSADRAAEILNKVMS